MCLQALSFPCGEDRLIGLLHRPQSPATNRGVLIVVGGPQYRVGSGRQFVLLAERLAAAGVPAMRFDHRGMGDSDGRFRGFLDADDDIRAAIDEFSRQCPQLQEVVLWGLCDASSSILLYAHRDPRVGGVVLLNPWVRSEHSEAKLMLTHYYRRRLLAADFWRKLARLQFDPRASLSSLGTYLRRAVRRPDTAADASAAPYQQRMCEGLRRFSGRVLLILSGDDLSAREFEQLVANSPDWQQLLADTRVERRRLDEADHTFSRRIWFDQVELWTRQWLTDA